MNIQKYIVSRFNEYSIIGSIVYGALCAFTTTYIPVVPFRFYSVYTFIAAALFYFGMYILYKSKPRNGALRFVGFGLLKIFSVYFVGLFVFGFLYSLLYHTSLTYGMNIVIKYATAVVYYLPFTP